MLGLDDRTEPKHNGHRGITVVVTRMGFPLFVIQKLRDFVLRNRLNCQRLTDRTAPYGAVLVCGNRVLGCRILTP